MGRYAKAIIAFLVGGLGTAQGLGITDGFSWSELITSLVTGLLAAGGVAGVPNAGFVDLSGLSTAQRAELNRFLNLDGPGPSSRS